MATNYIQEGDKTTVAAPFAVTRGNIVVVNTNLFGVAEDNAASAANVVLAHRGVYSFTKTSGASTSAAVGGYAYWDNTNSKATISATSNTKIGVFVAAATNNDTTVRVRLNPSF
jgi:predicted RecA/RadA family phage recombinase